MFFRGCFSDSLQLLDSLVQTWDLFSSVPKQLLFALSTLYGCEQLQQDRLLSGGIQFKRLQ